MRGNYKGKIQPFEQRIKEAEEADLNLSKEIASGFAVAFIIILIIKSINF